MSVAVTGFTAVNAQTREPLRLAMQRLWLTGEVLAAGARLKIRHDFVSEESKPLEVVYAFILPRDAALRRFRVRGTGFEVESELKETGEAARIYEEGIAQGSLSTLARNYEDGLVNLTVGNIRPGEAVEVELELLAGVEAHDDGFRFRFPFTLSPVYHPRARTFSPEPGRGELELPADVFGDVLLPQFHANSSDLHQVGFDLAVAGAPDMEELASPSHAVGVRRNEEGRWRVALAPECDVPNRDLVLDARWKAGRAQVLAGRLDDGRVPFAAVVPSSEFGANTTAPRRVVILLDRSGSMGGLPLDQAKKAVGACLAGLSGEDLFGLVAFDKSPESMHPELLPATRENREKAGAFLASVQAAGGTELAQGFEMAAKVLHGPGDVLILTDGQVGGSNEILARARKAETRLHCLGIGAASQDRFLAQLARETGGVSRFVTPSERVDIPAVDLFASIGRPVASGVRASSGVEPSPASAVFKGTPLVLFGQLDPGQPPTIGLTWDGGSLDIPVVAAGGGIGETVRLLRGARLITDWEARYPAEEALAPLEKRKQSRAATRLRALSEEYGLASREMSLVAVVKRAGDRPGELPETRVVPVGMPESVKMDAYFAASSVMAPPPLPPSMPMPMQAAPTAMAANWVVNASAKPGAFTNVTKKLFQRAFLQKEDSAPTASLRAPTADDVLLDLALRIEPDGGMPGRDVDERTIQTIVAVFAFLSQGHGTATGAFRSHVARLVAFLGSVKAPRHAELVAKVVGRARQASAVAGADWLKKAETGRVDWKELEKVLLN